MKIFKGSKRRDLPEPPAPRVETPMNREQAKSVPEPVAARAPLPGGGRDGGGGTGSVIGRTISIQGDIVAAGDLRIEGSIVGSVRALAHALVIGEGAKVQASLEARQVIVHGYVTGDITARERIEIAPTGKLMGDISAPRVTLSDGSSFTGSINREGAPAVMERAAKPREPNLLEPDPVAPAATPASASTSDVDRRGKDRPWSGSASDGSGHSSPTTPR